MPPTAVAPLREMDLGVDRLTRLDALLITCHHAVRDLRLHAVPRASADRVGRPHPGERREQPVHARIDEAISLHLDRKSRCADEVDVDHVALP